MTSSSVRSSPKYSALVAIAFAVCCGGVPASQSDGGTTPEDPDTRCGRVGDLAAGQSAAAVGSDPFSGTAQATCSGTPIVNLSDGAHGVQIDLYLTDSTRSKLTASAPGPFPIEIRLAERGEQTGSALMRVSASAKTYSTNGQSGTVFVTASSMGQSGSEVRGTFCFKSERQNLGMATGEIVSVSSGRFRAPYIGCSR